MQDPGFIEWLLDAQTPSIRYLTLRDLLGKSENDPQIVTVREEMETSGPIPLILGGQTRIGSWAGERSYYTPKFTSTHWSMLLLAELACDGLDARMRRGAIFMLGETWELLQKRVRKRVHDWTCLWANMLRYALHCQLDDDPRLHILVEAVAQDGLKAKWRCEYNENKPCAWGASRSLWALAALPEHMRTPDIQDSIQNGLTFLLEKHDLLSTNYPAPEGSSSSKLWTRLNFPLFYQADILFVLRTLAELDVLHLPSAQPALEWLHNRRMANSHWRGASPFRRRTWIVLGDRQEIDRWVSLHAAMVLSKAGYDLSL